MTSDPAPSYPSDPPTQATPAHDPWAPSPAVPQDTAGFHPPPVQPPHPTAPFPAAPPPALPVDPATPPVAGPYSAVPAQYSAPPAQYSAPPAQYSAPPAHFSAPPAVGSLAPTTGPFGQVTGESAAYGGPPGADPYAASPMGQPGPYPPLFAPPAPGAAVGQPAAVQIGEILVSPPVIRTPAGVMPLAGANWYVTDYWQREEKIASWAIVCAILGFFCLTIFSLLFLLIKETRHYGTVQVTVTSGGHQYVARIPVVDQGQVQQINNQVNYARSLSTV
ncbi:hypothetical protein GA0070216_114104 [Micromonospora matsumotoense]|uniref:Uncharacterized protein n=1 Tax=Micromonospora matsumotoense TaxID=121616 RepID=A0A1C5A7A6_9ACTN|nr:hypothetical protein [Micromonospora matsumotoense]SCF41133.1 hypothetical protein GA0070216_114104 [Micromonospora matsumotoense]